MWLKLKWWLLRGLIGRDTVIFNAELVGDLEIIHSYNGHVFVKNFNVRDNGGNELRPVAPYPEQPSIH